MRPAKTQIRLFVDIFSYSGLLGILGFDGKQHTNYAGARA